MDPSTLLLWTDTMVAGLIACADYNLRTGGNEMAFTTLATQFIRHQHNHTVSPIQIERKLRKKFRVGTSVFARKARSVINFEDDEVAIWCDAITQADKSLLEYIMIQQRKSLEEKDIEIERLKERLQCKDDECSSLRFKVFRHEKERELTSIRNMRWRNHTSHSQEAVEEIKRNLDEQTSRIVSYIGPMSLFDEVELRLFEDIDISMHLEPAWHKISHGIKDFSREWADHNREKDMSHKINLQDVSSGIPEDFETAICTHRYIVHATMREVFGRTIDCHDRYPLELLNDVFQLLYCSVGSLKSIKRMACLLYRPHLECFLKDDAPEKSMELAAQMYTELESALNESPSTDDSVSRESAMEKIRSWLMTAFELLVALQLHNEEYRIVSFPIGTPYNPHWMLAENADGTRSAASEAELRRLKVSILLFPALAQLPEASLEGTKAAGDWELVMPRKNPCLDDEGLVEADWRPCGKALVILE